jgi:hypothetical protein
MIKHRYFLIALLVFIASSFLCVCDAQAKYSENKSLTVTLNIEKHYKVRFDANGGTGSMGDQTFTVGSPQALSSNQFVNGGYFFAGWNTSADGSGTSYIDGQMISTDLTNIGGGIVKLYAQWGNDAMQVAFKIDGTCVFHGYDIQQGVGDGHITGSNCMARGTDWADGSHTYIDTGVKLYDEANYDMDYEVGFTITAYDYEHQYKDPGSTASQATFFNAKLEDSARHWPGITVRKSAEKLEITETITKPNGSNEKKTAYGTTVSPIKVVITRVEGVVYYSINDSAFTKLQDINNTSDYFDTNAWFGASSTATGDPMRYIDATMTNIYIKVGERGANKHTVSFDAGGVVSNPSNVTIIGSSKIGTSLPGLPNFVDTADGRLYFIGWYSGVDGTGVKYSEDSIISRDVTMHAYWSDEPILCEVGGVTHGDLQACIDSTSPGDTITLLDNIRAQVSVDGGKEFTLDLNGHKLSDNSVAGMPVIENFGKITVINGTITSSLRAGVLNNNGTGEMHIGNDARIVATGVRQAIYNKGGILEISGNAYLSATSDERAAVQNLENGSLTITGGTIISSSQEAVKVESGTLVIGVEDGTATRNTPILQGATYGLNTSVDVTMYDGVLRGKNNAINNTARITTTEAGATAVGINPTATEVVDGVTYKIIYYE